MRRGVSGNCYAFAPCWLKCLALDHLVKMLRRRASTSLNSSRAVPRSVWKALGGIQETRRSARYSRSNSDSRCRHTRIRQKNRILSLQFLLVHHPRLSPFHYPHSMKSPPCGRSLPGWLCRIAQGVAEAAEAADERRHGTMCRIGKSENVVRELFTWARVRAAGLPEDQVVWVSRNDPMADHDIRSVGEDGRTIWIEVKSTTGRDGRFQWSRSEIELAIRKRERYILYRVYAADSVRPVVKPFPNPAPLLLTWRLRLDVAVLQAEVEGAG